MKNGAQDDKEDQEDNESQGKDETHPVEAVGEYVTAFLSSFVIGFFAIMLGAIVPVAVVTFILVAIYPESAYWVDTFVCSEGAHMHVDRWSEYNPDTGGRDEGFELRCLYENGDADDVENAVLIALGLSMTVTLAVLGAFMEARRFKDKRKAKTQESKQDGQGGRD